MYSRIQQEKEQGFSKEAVARHLSLSWRTVNRYWDMTVETYNTLQKKNHQRVLDKHETAIVDWLERFPDLSSAQVQDWIHEHYNEIYPDRTIRNHVNYLRAKHGIEKANKKREYASIPELPPGQQMQADFGEYWALRQDKNRIKLYFVAFILAHSRYKYIAWQTRPFKTVDFVRCLESCFDEFGGMPNELVIDQDKLMVVSENYGDIIHTFEFERCKNHYGFSVWLCRKGDPESKGLVESCVKFVKYNFARNRCFQNLTQWTLDCKEWLNRTGNGKVHAETKNIPAEVFELEKKYLKPVTVHMIKNDSNDMLTTPVRKNNTIRYNSNRYSVPIGTYTNCKAVSVQEIDGTLEIYDPAGNFIAKHSLATSPGDLVRNNNHGRDTTEKIDKLMAEALNALGNTPQAEAFLQTIKRKRGRYIRDQLQIVLSVAKSYEPEVIRLAILACRDEKLDSALDFRDFAEFTFRQVTIDQIIEAQAIRPMEQPPKHTVENINVTQYSPESYMVFMKGGRKSGRSNQTT